MHGLSESFDNVRLPNGMNVPAWQGRLFCSRRDPVREAQDWFLRHEKSIGGAEKILILGLGAGLHLLNFETSQEISVLELRPGLIEIFLRRELPGKPQIQFVDEDFAENATVLEFRPAWMGLEARYEALSRKFRAVDVLSLADQAEKRDLWGLSEALRNSKWAENIELTVKDIVDVFPLENQTTEAKIWRALRELVA